MKVGVGSAAVFAIVLLGSSGCSKPRTCEDLLDRIAQIDSVAPITDPSFADIQALTERGIRRDQLRAEFLQRGC